MPTPWIDRSKLIAPQPPEGALERAWLPEGAAPAAVVLTAGPGYGKTTALGAIARTLAGPEGLVLWYAADAFDDDLATFFHHLVAAMRQHIPQFGEELLALVAGGKLEPRMWLRRFFEAAAGYNLPRCVLAIDDFHHLAGPLPELAKGLSANLERLPEGLHVLVAARRRVLDGLARAEAQGRVRVLDQARLRFSADEETAFLSARAGGPIPPAWREAAARLEGWPLGLDRLGQAGERLSSYLAEELYQAQPESRRELLLQASLLPAITPDALAAIFDREAPATDLKALHDDHVIERLEDGGYRLPAYWQEFLRTALDQEVPAATRQAWRAKIAADCMRRGDHDHAFVLHLEAGDMASAVAAGRACFPAMRYSGRYARWKSWLDRVPASVRDADPWFSLWHGLALARAGEITEATGAIARAEAAFARSEEPAGRFKALVCLANAALLTDDQPGFERWRAAAEALETEGFPEDVADLHLVRAMDCDNRGDFDGMRRANEAVLALPRGENLELAASHCIAALNLFTHALHQGRLFEAGVWIARAIEAADAQGFYAYGLFARFLQAHQHLLMGDPDAAGTFLKDLPTDWAAVLDWHDEACAHTVLGAYHQARGDWKEAEAALARALAIFDKADFRQGRHMTLERLLWLAVQRKQYGRAAQLADLAGETAERNVYELALRIPQARALHLAGDAQAALSVFQRVLPDLDRQGARLHLTRGRLYEAAAHLQLGEAAAAREAYAAAMVQREEYAFLLGQDQALWAELAALESPVLERRVPQAASGRLSLRCFGSFEVRRDGVLVDQWSRRKAKLVLAALILHPRGLSYTEMAEVFGELDPQAVQVLRANVVGLRRALEPELEKGGASRYVRQVEERFVLNGDFVEFLDVQAFEAGMAEGDRLKDTSPTEAAAQYEAALAHYRGHFLDEPLFIDHFESTRERLRRQAVTALGWLGDYHHQRCDDVAAEATYARAIALAPCDGALSLALIRHYQFRHRPDRIRQVYWDYRKALKRHLGLAPDAEFEATFRAAIQPR